MLCHSVFSTYFNRTILEWKFDGEVSTHAYKGNFNRTILEWKYSTSEALAQLGYIL